jgi:tRNA dimethylallyltransferase
VDPELREKISVMESGEALARLGEADSEAPGQIDARNPVRVRRALEIVLSTGKPLSASRADWKSEGSGFRGILLERDRVELWKRIEANVDAMFDDGVVEEVRRAAGAGDGASRAIGFHEIQELLAGRISAHECRMAIVTSTRRYAKRQLTWCRHQFNFPVIPLTATNPPVHPIESALQLLGGISA